MNISDVAQSAGLPAKTIRYYEEIGLVRPTRAANGYRTFDAAQVDTLRFLARARALGFSIEDCRVLLSLQSDPTRASAAVKEVARGHLGEIDRKIAELEALRGTLTDLVARCPGDDGPTCAILDDLARDARSDQGKAARP